MTWKVLFYTRQHDAILSKRKFFSPAAYWNEEKMNL